MATAVEEYPSLVAKSIKAHLDDHKDLFVPGKAVYVYHDGAGNYGSAVGMGDLSVLKNITLCGTMVDDHLLTPYATAIKGALGAAK